MHCHHEKLVIVDDELAFVGGIDLTDAGRRPLRHQRAPAQGGGSAGTTRPRCCAGRSCATSPRTSRCAGRRPRARRSRCRRTSPPAGDTTVQFVRTVPEGAYRVLPRGEFSVLETYIRALRSAAAPDLPREPVPVVAGDRPHPRDQAAQPAARRLPRRRPAPAQGQQRPGRHARDARPARRRRRRRASSFLAATILSRTGERSGPAVRARQDRDRRRRVARDRLARTSTSTRCSTTPRSTSSRATRRSPAPRGCGCGRSTSSATTRRRPGAVVDERWRPIATEQLERRARGAPLTHHLVELPGVSRRSRRLLGPLDALVVDG